jgi:TIR domain
MLAMRRCLKGALVMADMFLSYAHQDTKRAETLANLLENAGLTVWWDRRMVAGDKIHDVIDEEIEKAKAVIVLWSPISVKSDWVRGEAQTAHELTKLVPIKIEECKLPINYRGIHTPEVYKNKAELNKLAQMLTDKYTGAQPSPRGATGEPSTSTKVEFSDKSSADFLTKLKAQQAAFDEEVSSTWAMGEWRGQLERYCLIKKYPLGAAPGLLLVILMLFAPSGMLLVQMKKLSLTTSAAGYAILVGLVFSIYVSYQRPADERWIDFAKEKIHYFVIGLFGILCLHSSVAYILFGISSFTFVTFAILTVLAAISHYKLTN